MSTPRLTVVRPSPPRGGGDTRWWERPQWALTIFAVHFAHVFGALEWFCYSIHWHLPVLGYGHPSILAAIEVAYLFAALPMGSHLLVEAQASRSQWAWLVRDLGAWQTIGFTVGLGLIGPPLACVRLAWAACQGRGAR